MDKKFIQIREKSLKDSPLDEYDLGMVSRKQLYTYLFSDLIRGSMIVGFMFMDVLVISQIWYFIPDFVRAMNLVSLFFGGINYVLIYYIVGTVFIEAVVLVYEKRMYFRVWKRIKEIALIN